MLRVCRYCILVFVLFRKVTKIWFFFVWIKLDNESNQNLQIFCPILVLTPIRNRSKRSTFQQRMIIHQTAFVNLISQRFLNHTFNQSLYPVWLVFVLLIVCRFDVFGRYVHCSIVLSSSQQNRFFFNIQILFCS